jgi:hypothetical protein
MDLNLIHVKVFPPRLFLFCKKKTDPFESILINKAIIGINQESMPTMIIVDKKISADRLMNLLIILSSGNLIGSVKVFLILVNFLSSVYIDCADKGAEIFCRPLITNISGDLGKILVTSIEDFS